MTEVDIAGNKRPMWLPVMDSRNNAMKQEAYVMKCGYKDVDVQQATMMDINKAIMRCIVKNLAMFGLGINIYAGEDLPIGMDDDAKPTEAKPTAKWSKSEKAVPSVMGLAKQAWAEFSALDYVKAMAKDARVEEWTKLLKDNANAAKTADVTAEGWEAIRAAIDVLKAV